jgi:hypothetical protein
MTNAQRCGKGVGCALPKHCAVGHTFDAWWKDSGQLDRRPGCRHCSGVGFKGRFHTSAYFFLRFKSWYFDNHFYSAVVKIIFVDVLI